MSSFTPASNSIVLTDGSRTPIQGIGTAAATPTLLLSFIFYLPFSMYLISLTTYYQ